MSVPMRWEEPVVPEAPIAPSRKPRRRSRMARRVRVVCLTLGLLSLAGVGSLAVVGANSLLHTLQAPPALHLESANASENVALGSASAERRLGFVTVTGSAISRTNVNLPKLEAVVELLDSQNHTLQVESSLVAFDPLPVGQSSPFRVELNDDARAVGYRVRFRQLLGPLMN